MAPTRRKLPFWNMAAKKLNALIWTIASVVAVLLLITTAVVALRLGSFLPNGTDVIFLVPKEPTAAPGDGEKIWGTETEIDIFKSEYVNGKNEITVLSSAGTGLIAPGTENSYKFYMKNNGNMAVDYSVDLDFTLDISDGSVDLSLLPLSVRMKKETGEYLIGSPNEWIPVHEVRAGTDEGTLGINSYMSYYLEVRWDFESGDDALDTWIGDVAAKQSVVFTLDIGTYAEESLNPGAVGGIVDENGGIFEIGGQIRPLPFTLLIVILVLLAASLVYTVIMRHRQIAEEKGAKGGGKTADSDSSKQ